MSSPATVDLDSGPLTLYDVNGWLKDQVLPLKIGAVVPFAIFLIGSVQCSLVDASDIVQAGLVLFLLPTAVFGSILLYRRGVRIVVDSSGLRRDSEQMPAWLKPLARPWFFRWEDVVDVQTSRRSIGAGRSRDTTIDMWFVLRDGRRIQVQPHFWLSGSGIEQQPTLQSLTCLPSAATPIGQAVRKWAPPEER